MQLNYRIHGEGSPIILIHGLFGSLDNLGQIAKVLDENYLTIQLDLRNHGKSPWNENMTIKVMTQDIIQLMDQLNLGNDVTVIGHSLGGKVAMMLAELAPERIMRLIILDIAPVTYHQRRHDEIFVALQAVADAHLSQRRQAALLMKKYLTDDNTILFLLKSFNQGQWCFNLPVIYRHYGAISDWHEISAWEKPILFIRGGLSDYIKREYWDIIARQFPLAKAHIIYGAGHWVHGDKPKQTIRAILRFLHETQ